MRTIHISLLAVISTLGCSSADQTGEDVSAAKIACDVNFTPADAAKIPDVVKGNTGGKTYCFAAGLYDLPDTIVPHTGDVYSGAGATTTTLRGAKPITAWTYDSGSELYKHSGDVVKNSPTGFCDNGGNECKYPDWLFLDDEPQERVLSPCTKTNVTAGKFCIDYASQTMFVKAKSAAWRYSWLPSAFGNAKAMSVTIQRLGVHEFASAYNSGGAISATDGWVLEHLDVGYNHAIGVHMTTNGGAAPPKVEHSALHHNGQKGAELTQCTSCVVQYNDVYANDYVIGYSSGYAAGIKLNATANAVVAFNDVHDNHVHGIWFDDDTTYSTIASNTITNNDSLYGGGEGIRLEISCHNTVTKNTLSGNAVGGIAVVNAHHNTIDDNTLSGPASQDFGVRITSNGRTGSEHVCGSDSDASNNTVSGNSITMPTGASVNGVTNTSGASSNTAGTAFTANEYIMPGTDCSAQRWKWFAGSPDNATFATWKATYKQDTTGGCK